MPYKRKRSSVEIDALAGQFRELWHPEDAMRPWLRTHAVMLRTMISNGWSWQGIADALKCAGITYQTGNALRGVILKNEVARACKQLKSAIPPLQVASESQTSTSPCSQQTEPDHSIPGTPPREILPAAVTALPTAPRFKPFTLKQQEPPRPLTPEEIEEREANRIRMFGQT